MIKLLSFIYALLLTSAHAQDSFKENLLLRYDDRLQQLELKGSNEVGYFPMCSDITDLYLEELNERARFIEETHYTKEELQHVRVEAKLDRENETQRHRVLGHESIRLVDGSITEKNYNNCFTDQTPVTVFYSQRKKVSTFEWTSNEIFKTISMQDMFYQQDKISFYALSSSIGKLENIKRYHHDCWAKVHRVYMGHMPKDSTMITLGVKEEQAEAYHLEVTPQHRFYTYVEDEYCPENGSYQWRQAQELDRGNMRLYPGEGGRLCEIAYTSDYKVKGNGLGNNKPVYNLNTETHAYYVGLPSRRVLVHDTKPNSN